jgi:hypothetical protein
VLTLLESLLAEAISQRESEYSFTTLLLKEALTHTEVLNYFIHYHFPQILNVSEESSLAPNREFITGEKMKPDISAAEMEVLAKALAKSVLHNSGKSQEEVILYIVAHFSSKETDELEITTFRENYRSPEPAAIDEAIEFLTRMINYFEKL